MKAWLQLISIGMVGAMITTSCVITSDDDDDDDDDFGDAGETSTGGRATGGRPGTGGTTTGGRASGGTGTGGTTGGTPATGGASATGGAGGEGGEAPDACSGESTPSDTCQFADADDCSTCLAESCCDEVSACYGTDPEDVCGRADTGAANEFECALDCLSLVSQGGDFPNDDDVDNCVAKCMQCTGLPSPNTLPLALCMNDNCPDDCY